ncbi:hypothetical protein POM88_033175 [Heracleum sosnowskyi]|uniref:Rx N-terminal domain-containing protein n=1 Tax=Heracleum sosnowskyi TaxID=360622 RepID=A0AAD8MLB8_9APIA|nr:hypothetical protein POM88_033175 [Heracleum sosnowskyi]
MAEVVSFAVKRLGELLISEATLLYEVRDKIEEIQRELTQMECFLEEAEKKQNPDKRVQNWVEAIREIAFKAEDVIENYALEVATKRQKSGLKKMLVRYVCILSEALSRHNIATEINDLKAVLSKLSANLPTYGITVGLTEDEGWLLLSKKVRINDLPDQSVAIEMEIIGRNMVQRCKVKEKTFISIIHPQREPYYESKARIVRRLCIRAYKDGNESMLKPYNKHVIQRIRSLLVWKGQQEVFQDTFFDLGKFKLLRVLNIQGYKINKQNLRKISELVYLRYLCLPNCELEDKLPSSVGNLRYLETLDIRVWNHPTILNVLWKLKQLKHLYLPKSFEIVEKLSLEGLNELEVIYNYDTKKCVAHDLFGLCKLKVFRGSILVEDNHTTENIINFINSRKMRHSNLTIEGGAAADCCLVLFGQCCYIDVLKINTGGRRNTQ